MNVNSKVWLGKVMFLCMTGRGIMGKRLYGKSSSLSSVLAQEIKLDPFSSVRSVQTSAGSAAYIALGAQCRCTGKSGVKGELFPLTVVCRELISHFCICLMPRRFDLLRISPSCQERCQRV